MYPGFQPEPVLGGERPRPQDHPMDTATTALEIEHRRRSTMSHNDSGISEESMREIGSSDIEQVFAALCNRQSDENGNQGTSFEQKMTAEQMSINEHLSSMPMPWFPNSDPEMLAMGGVGPPQLGALGQLGGMLKNNDLQNNNTSRCGDGSSSGVSSHSTSSSCSPVTASMELLNATRQLNESHGMSHLDRVMSSTLGVTDMLEALKTEPMDTNYLGAMMQQQQQQQQRPTAPRQPMPLHLSFSRSSESTLSQPQDHRPAPTRRTRSSSDGMLKCQFCPKKLLDENKLHVHMSECRLIRSHECQQCGRRFKARGGLQQHMRIHSNDKPYPCNFCSKRFTQKSHVDQHERIHTGAKPFICTFCGRAFRQRSQQLGHESTHSHGNHAGAVSAQGTGTTTSATASSTGTSSLGNASPLVSPRVTDTLTSSLAAAVMQQQQQQQQHNGFSDILGQLENRQMMDATGSNNLLGTGPTSAISSLLALSQHSQRQDMAHSLHHHHRDPSEFGLLNSLH